MKSVLFVTVALLSPVAVATGAIASPHPEVSRSQAALSMLEASLLKPVSVPKSEPKQVGVKISVWRSQIQTAAAKHHVDPALVAAILLDEQRRWDRHYFNPSDTRESPWVYIGDDTVTNTLAENDASLALERNWSIGIAQMKPQTALGVSDLNRETVIAALLDESKSIDLVAAAIAKTIEDWRQFYPGIEKRPDLIATLYSQGYQFDEIRGCPTSHPKGCPDSNRRGKEIARDVSHLRVLLDGPPNYTAAK